MALKIISYIYHDPDNTGVYWQGYTETFDDDVISVADKIAEQYDLRTSGLTPNGTEKAEAYFFDQSLIIADQNGGAVIPNIEQVLNAGEQMADGQILRVGNLGAITFDFASFALGIGVSNLTAGRTQTFQDKDGIIALLSDILNIFNSDGALTGNRTLNANGNTFTFDDVSQLNIQTNGGKITIDGQNLAAFNSAPGQIILGDPIRQVVMDASETIINNRARINEIRGFATQNNVIRLVSIFQKVFSSPGGEGGAQLKNRFTTDSPSLPDSTLHQIDDNGVISHRVRADGQIIMPNLPVFTSVALAQADVTLEIGSLYYVATSVFGLIQNNVHIKV